MLYFYSSFKCHSGSLQLTTVESQLASLLNGTTLRWSTWFWNYSDLHSIQIYLYSAKSHPQTSHSAWNKSVPRTIEPPGPSEQETCDSGWEETWSRSRPSGVEVVVRLENTIRIQTGMLLSQTTLTFGVMTCSTVHTQKRVTSASPDQCKKTFGSGGKNSSPPNTRLVPHSRNTVCIKH